jgi:hypothetical protein
MTLSRQDSEPRGSGRNRAREQALTGISSSAARLLPITCRTSRLSAAKIQEPRRSADYSSLFLPCRPVTLTHQLLGDRGGWLQADGNAASTSSFLGDPARNTGPPPIASRSGVPLTRPSSSPVRCAASSAQEAKRPCQRWPTPPSPWSEGTGAALAGLAQGEAGTVGSVGDQDQVRMVGHRAAGPCRNPVPPAPGREQVAVQPAIGVAEEGRLSPIAPPRRMVRHPGRHRPRRTP